MGSRPRGPTSRWRTPGGHGRGRDRRSRLQLRADRPGGSLPHPGTVVQAGRAAARGGGCLEAGPRPARRPRRSQSRRRRSAAAVVRLRNDLAWLWANHPDPSRRDPASAVSMALRAAGEFPEAPAYWNTLGVAHYRAGDDHAAVDALDRAGPWAAGRPSTTSSWPWRTARLGDPAEAGQALARNAPGRTRLPGPLRAGRLLRRGPLHPRRRHRHSGRGPLTPPAGSNEPDSGGQVPGVRPRSMRDSPHPPPCDRAVPIQRNDSPRRRNQPASSTGRATGQSGSQKEIMSRLPDFIVMGAMKCATSRSMSNWPLSRASS